MFLSGLLPSTVINRIWLEATWGRKGLFHLTVYRIQSIIGGTKTGTWKQELKQKPRRSAACLLVTHGLPSFLSCITQDHLTIHHS